MRRDPINPLERVQDEPGGARVRVGRGFHGHGRARDIAGLRLQWLQISGLDNNRQMLFPAGEIIRGIADESMKVCGIVSPCRQAGVSMPN